LGKSPPKRTRRQLDPIGPCDVRTRALYTKSTAALVPDPSPLRPLHADDSAALRALAESRGRLEAQVHRRIVGQDAVVDLLLCCLFAGGHGLFVGVPGLAKTMLVSALAEALDLEFSRIQFTPDLMPADITGSEVLEEDAATGKRMFRFVAGPVFCNLLLADEINRTPPKTQAALLQSMQERRVSAGGTTHRLPPPFHVFATQNPIEQEGTYPLPEAQLDRFMLQIVVDYPDAEAERQIVAMGGAEPADIEAVLSPVELLAHQDLVRRIPVPQSVVDHVVDLLRASRPASESAPTAVKELLRWGAGPRAGQQLISAAQARAALDGRPAVTVEDARALAPAVLEHRLVRSFVAESRGVTTREIMSEILGAVEL
jgi:MoxR-like ATPase